MIRKAFWKLTITKNKRNESEQYNETAKTMALSLKLEPQFTIGWKTKVKWLHEELCEDYSIVIPGKHFEIDVFNVTCDRIVMDLLETFAEF